MDNIEGQNNKLNRTQKTGFVLLFVFTLLVVGLGFLQMRNTIYSPFVVKVENNQGKIGVSDENTKLQNIDTDRDGINDYEELYFYETSPYLPDTDSDGIGDKEEITAGTDPNCPESEVCEEVYIASSTTNLSPIKNIGSVDASAVQTGGTSIEDLQNILQDPEKVRKLLLDTGQISQEQLDGIDDQTLMSLVEKMLAEESGNITP
ncbi:MAG: thrombospondin type 3 repeat-containing protein [Candidatus Magasanikbacteria bacterium]|nr:thrombospondin type 3 repeat-containing protein [Candidatus Magasanikbacteria bacterium]